MSVAVETSLVEEQQSWRTVFGHWPRRGGGRADSAIEGRYLVWRSDLIQAVPSLLVTSRVCCGLEGGSTAPRLILTADLKMTRPSLVTDPDCALGFEKQVAGCERQSPEE